ncbi:MAG: N-formylglutamate amidohydrolase [Betaproteobacteria bacterium]
MPARRTDVRGLSERPFFLVTCEHGGNRVPPELAAIFEGCDALLQSHRGLDLGAALLAQEMARALDAVAIIATTSRLVVDLNRSPGHPGLFSEPMRCASTTLREQTLVRHYRPYRQQVETLVTKNLATGRQVIHISSHSFTPNLDGRERAADIGLLYDPGRAGEVPLARAWLSALRRHAPELTVRRNFPYRGKSDGFCTYLRRQHPEERYIGIELEVNQKHVIANGPSWPALRRTVVASLLEATASAGGEALP